MSDMLHVAADFAPRAHWQDACQCYFSNEKIKKHTRTHIYTYMVYTYMHTKSAKWRESGKVMSRPKINTQTKQNKQKTPEKKEM